MKNIVISIYNIQNEVFGRIYQQKNNRNRAFKDNPVTEFSGKTRILESGFRFGAMHNS